MEFSQFLGQIRQYSSIENLRIHQALWNRPLAARPYINSDNFDIDLHSSSCIS